MRGIVARLGPAAIVAAAVVVPGIGLAQPPSAAWPSFRGPSASGIAVGKPAPTAWDVETGTGLRWRTPIPGLGHGSPIIAGDRVFVTTAISGKPDAGIRTGLYGDITPVQDDTAHEWKVYCLDRRSGAIRWERTAKREVPRTKRHTKATQANCTPVTDGRRLVVCFGSEGLYCYDMDGKPLWQRDLGALDSGYFQFPSAQWGFASSPILFENTVILQVDVQKGGYLAAFSLKDGAEVWKTPRTDVPTWSTPTIVATKLGPTVVVNGWKHIGGYDARTGRERWRLRGGGDIPVPTPVVGDDLIFLTSAHGRMAPIYAIRRDAEGDITPASETALGPDTSHMAWMRPRDGGYMQTPIFHDGRLYVCRDNGVLGCFDARTGAVLYQERLSVGNPAFTASGVLSGGVLYYTSEDGDVHLVRAGVPFARLGSRSVGETCLATPAVVDGVIYFRTRGHLLAVDGKSRLPRR